MAFGVYWPALAGPFLSDDLHYVAQNPYIQQLDLASLRALLDPTSGVAVLVENYAPVHLLAHALAWQLFGPQTLGHHALNVALHAAAGWLLALYASRLGVRRELAWLGGACFLLHPAQVEAVAWISQLKSGLALCLALGALLARERRPAPAALLFTLALLAKPSALFALPVAAAEIWLVSPASARRRALGWLGAWVALFALFAAVELAAFAHSAGTVGSLYADPLDRLRSHVAIVLRYATMVITGIGLSTFHEPAPAASWLDPRWLGGLALSAAVAGRALWTARRRERELLGWVWVAAAYAPASGLLALPYPMADRYLHPVLAGLVLTTLLWLQPRLGRGALARGGPRAALALAVVVWLAFLAIRAHERAELWTSSARMLADSVVHYPEGTAAQLTAARRAARTGDARLAVEALRRAHARGWDRLDQLRADPTWAPVRRDPRFRELEREIAGHMLERLGRNPEPSQLELHAMALAHEVRGEREAAIRALERALAVGGPRSERVRADLEGLRAKAPPAGSQP